MEPSIVALIPVNHLDQAKSRLSSFMSPEERATLAVTTMQTVVGAVIDAGGEPIVLTADEQVARHLGSSIEILAESPERSGLNGQLEYALALLDEPELLIIHADLPLADGESLLRVVNEAPPPRSATAVRSPDGGTNAMLLSPPRTFALQYGRDSYARHRQAAQAAGVTFRTAVVPSLTLDLDTPGDLGRLLQSEPGRESPAGKLLLEWDVPRRLERFTG